MLFLSMYSCIFLVDLDHKLVTTYGDDIPKKRKCEKESKIRDTLFFFFLKINKTYKMQHKRILNKGVYLD